MPRYSNLVDIHLDTSDLDAAISEIEDSLRENSARLDDLETRDGDDRTYEITKALDTKASVEYVRHLELQLEQLALQVGILNQKHDTIRMAHNARLSALENARKSSFMPWLTGWKVRL